jgi:predicted HicB family RNase H-like nuclease
VTPSGRGRTKPSQPDRALEQYLALPYHVTLVRDGDGEDGPWVAQVEELAGCTSRAATAEQATSGIQQAMSDWISEALREGREVPEPKPVDEHSGRLLLRMPRTLHAELTRLAEREGISLNQFITDALASAVGWRLAHSAGRTATGSLNQVPGAQALTPGPQAEPGSEERRSRRLLITLLGANAVVLAIAAIVAAIVLVVALR